MIAKKMVGDSEKPIALKEIHKVSCMVLEDTALGERVLKLLAAAILIYMIKLLNFKSNINYIHCLYLL